MVTTVRLGLLLLATIALISGCAFAGVRGTAWDNRPEDCWREHPNGLWERDHCREGKGALVWSTWIF